MGPQRFIASTIVHRNACTSLIYHPCKSCAIPKCTALKGVVQAECVMASFA